MAQLDRYLEAAVNQRASDIHIVSEEPVRLRVDGDLFAVDEPALSAEDVGGILFEILTDSERERCKEKMNLDRSYSVQGIGNFRVNIFFTRKGPAAVLRTIPTVIPSIEELGLPPVVRALSELPKGLVLVTGPTGSGKSTSLAAMINHINSNFPYHILTVEDPVEFIHGSKRSLVNQREIGSSCATFADALKYALREDPDVILVGEMRDLETIALALTAAETGHLVFGTLHTRGAAASIDRIIDSFPANQQAMIRTMLSDSLAAVISQALIKRADHKGRVAAYEIMVVNHAISNLIREGKTFQIASIIQTARRDGMILMEQHVRELLAKELVDPVDASAYIEGGATPEQKKDYTVPVSQTQAPLAPAKKISVAPRTVASPVTPPAQPPTLAHAPEVAEAPRQKLEPTLGTPPPPKQSVPPSRPATIPSAPLAPKPKIEPTVVSTGPSASGFAPVNLSSGGMAAAPEANEPDHGLPSLLSDIGDDIAPPPDEKSLTKIPELESIHVQNPAPNPVPPPAASPSRPAPAPTAAPVPSPASTPGPISVSKPIAPPPPRMRTPMEPIRPKTPLAPPPIKKKIG